MSEIGPLSAKPPSFGPGPTGPGKDPYPGREGNDTRFARVLAEERALAHQSSAQPLLVKRSVAQAGQIGALKASAASSMGSSDTPLLDAVAPAALFRASGSEERYSAEASVADAAVAFSARPIVAPSSFEHASEDALIAPAEMGQLEIAERRGTNTSRSDALSDLGKRKGDTHPVADPRSVQLASLPALAGPIAGSAITPMQSAGRSSTASIAQPGRRAAVPGSDGQQPQRLAGSSTTVRQLPWVSHSSPAFAQLLASPSEYRVLIRGQKLNASERVRLRQEINAQLTQLGLPFHPVELMHFGRGA